MTDTTQIDRDDLGYLFDVEAALQRSPFDISPCSICGLDVVCLPEGGALCVSCNEALQAHDQTRETR